MTIKHHLDVLTLIYRALRQYETAEINDVVLDGEGDDSQVVLSLDNGETIQDFVVKAIDITETERN